MRNEGLSNETRLEVNLEALEENLAYYRDQLHPDTRIMVMVKAASYGFGAVGIPKFLEQKGVDYLGVAFADEGERLRDHGIRMPIMVMNPGQNSFNKILDQELEPLVYNERCLEQLIHTCERRKEKGPIPMHLKVETGMNRLGLPEDRISRVVERLKDQRHLLELHSVMSHLASSSFPDFDFFTKEQMVIFQRICEQVEEGLGHPFIRHILNSAGVSRFTNAQFDMVRLGIGLYGVGATDKDRMKLRNIARLRTTISQIKEVPMGGTVGYDRAFQAERPTRIAIIPIGYADGFSRPLGKGVGIARVNGRIVHVVGKVSMDMAFLDVTDVMCQEGDMVVLFDEEYPLTEFARSMNKIPYEAITNISERLPRDLFHPKEDG